MSRYNLWGFFLPACACCVCGAGSFFFCLKVQDPIRVPFGSYSGPIRVLFGSHSGPSRSLPVPPGPSRSLPVTSSPGDWEVWGPLKGQLLFLTTFELPGERGSFSFQKSFDYSANSSPIPRLSLLDLAFNQSHRALLAYATPAAFQKTRCWPSKEEANKGLKLYE